MPGRAVTADFHPAVQAWFDEAFEAPTRPQREGWPVIARGDSTLILAPTGTGKTLTAFLACLNRLMFTPPPAVPERCRVLYLSPLKALAVDVDRNLRAPLAGIAAVAARRGESPHVPAVWVRTGDTPAAERARFSRTPADILITTPESLFLLLTSQARDRLRSIETVIIDEIHALVGTKRGAHLAVSLERLEALVARPLQRIGLSATQRSLDEVSLYLGGATAEDTPTPRPVTLVDAREPKRLSLTVEVALDDMSSVGRPVVDPSGPAAQPPQVQTIWNAIHPRLVELIRAHRSTLVFVNSRRLAERLAAALNELAGTTLVRAHHGSLARAQRTEIEDLLKSGRLPGLIATSSLELGIDMGAIDLVVQIEAPPSVASGLQRIGRAGHRVGDVSAGIIFPKFRGDLLACAAVTRAMHDGAVEANRMPRTPLDVLAQQLVAMAAVEAWPVEALYRRVRQAAPFTTLTRRSFDGVLDMLSGRYPSDEFAELRPRLTWDRVNDIVTARQGAARIAIANAGTIPDRGLYGVFLAGGGREGTRVGELDEEMVFEARPGETFVLGASTWRIEQITHDRVLVSPAPGEPGKMPFWKGEGPGRPIEVGRAMGALTRALRALPPPRARDELASRHALTPQAADNLLQYLQDQADATGVIPDDETIVIERTPDDLGDWRVSVLTPFGSRVHAPWSMAVAARLRQERGLDAEVMYSDDGFVVRVPEGDAAPDGAWFLPDPDEVEDLVVGHLGSTALFAARFREAAGRALLLPRRRAGARAPLWQQRKRAGDLLAVAARYGSFPIVLEAYRECLRDVFDVPALVGVLRDLRSRRLRVSTVDTRLPSPFAASLLYGYVATYLYDGDAPLAERRAHALAVDQAQLRELIGEGALRELLSAEAIGTAEDEAQCLAETHQARSADGLHDLLLRLGDLSPAELEARTRPGLIASALDALIEARRVLPLRIGGERRYVAVEDAARYRDALGTPLPQGLPEALLAPVPDAVLSLVRRYARTHGPFQANDLARRFGLGVSVVDAALLELRGAGRVVDGEFRPGGHGREWCDTGMLRIIRRQSLARLRDEVAPVEPAVLGRFLVQWHGIGRPRRGLDALLDVVEQLQGTPLVASTLESQVLSSRLEAYAPAQLDTLLSAGEVTWVGLDPLGEHDGRVALYLTDHLTRLLPPAAAGASPALPPRAAAILAYLLRQGAAFFAAIHEASGGGFPQETVDALWSLVWQGLVTNDALHPLRAYLAGPGASTRRDRRATGFRSRRLVPASAEGRWSAVPAPVSADGTAWATAMTQQWLTRHGVVTRDLVAIDPVPGGFSAVYPVLRRLEETGRIRRGYFVAGLGAAQFATPGAVDLLRAARTVDETPQVAVLAATDPASVYGALVDWPQWPRGAAAPLRASRSAGARVVLVDGVAVAWLARGGRALLLALPPDEPERTRAGQAVARALARLGHEGPPGRRGLLLAEINGADAAAAPEAHCFTAAGFVPTAGGLQLRVPRDA